MGQAVVRVVSGAPALPRLFAPDEAAARRFLFTANIRNLNTRRAYARAAVMLRDAAVFDHRAQARGFRPSTILSKVRTSPISRRS